MRSWSKSLCFLVESWLYPSIAAIVGITAYRVEARWVSSSSHAFCGYVFVLLPQVGWASCERRHIRYRTEQCETLGLCAKLFYGLCLYVPLCGCECLLRQVCLLSLCVSMIWSLCLSVCPVFVNESVCVWRLSVNGFATNRRTLNLYINAPLGSRLEINRNLFQIFWSKNASQPLNLLKSPRTNWKYITCLVWNLCRFSSIHSNRLSLILSLQWGLGWPMFTVLNCFRAQYVSSNWSSLWSCFRIIPGTN